MRAVSRRRTRGLVVPLLGLLVARSVAAQDPPPDPRPHASPLLDDERAFFAWWDGLGYPDVTKLPFVLLHGAKPFHFRPPREVAHPVGAFLVSEDDAATTLFHTDLSTQRVGTSPRARDGSSRDVPRVERADLAAFVRRGLDELAAVGPDVPWFDEPDPFGAHRWAYPSQAFRLAILARACAGRGREDLAHALCERARHLQTRARSQPLGPDDPGTRAPLESLKASIVREAAVVLDWRFAEPGITWSQLLDAHLEHARRFGLRTDEDDVAVLRTMTADEQARAGRAPPSGVPSEDEQIAALVHDLQEVATEFLTTDGGDVDEEGSRPDLRLAALGFAAVPALIDALDDRRFTRSRWVQPFGKARFRERHHGLRVGDLAWVTLSRISAGALQATPYGDAETRRQLAERWFERLRTRGEEATLADVVRGGGAGSRKAADRLTRLDPALAIEALEDGIRAVRDADREDLVSLLAGIDDARATDALLRLLPLLERTRAVVRAASSLAARGRPEGLASLIRAWEAYDADPSAVSRWHVGAFATDDLVRALASTGRLEAIRALAAGLERRAVGVRIDAVAVFMTPRAPAPDPATERAIEELLAGRLEDEDRDENLHLAGVAVGEQPIVGEIAAWTLARRYPTRYAFDPDARPSERRRQRVAAANVWRASRGRAPLPLPPTPQAPAPLSIEEIRAEFERVTGAPDDSARAAAVAALEGRGLAALPPIRDAVEGLPVGTPGRAAAERVVRRLAFVVTEVRVESHPSWPPGLRAALEGTKGVPFSGAAWFSLWTTFARSVPEGVTWTLGLRLEREAATLGASLQATLTVRHRAPASLDVRYELPRVHRRGGPVGAGSGSRPLAHVIRSDAFAEHVDALDRALADSALDEVVVVDGWITASR